MALRPVWIVWSSSAMRRACCSICWFSGSIDSSSRIQVSPSLPAPWSAPRELHAGDRMEPFPYSAGRLPRPREAWTPLPSFPRRAARSSPGFVAGVVVWEGLSSGSVLAQALGSARAGPATYPWALDPPVLEKAQAPAVRRSPTSLLVSSLIVSPRVWVPGQVRVGLSSARGRRDFDPI